MILVTGVILIGIRKMASLYSSMFHTRGVCSIYWNEETIILSDSGNTASPTLLDPDKFQKEIGKGAMGCLTAHIDERCGCDHLDNILWKIG